ncbi:metalloendopeptidase-like membrane protein [Shewanella psychrophila]|uniref:Metalloendopeptidase-like membrane protein n=1 Tax=Shewanella psychrophila TaxID=225848 RepID=A0A1S6HQA2_9GAMM|nr:peptidoglycan DD-metalloendopeptidase family protein [Shewanella psychrophila]AQS37672.1 metalloendopeptidase-like membrane protein [Shewanella psychrophila]
MGKVITLLKLLPKVHQILLCFLVLVTLIIIILPSSDTDASNDANSRLSGSIDLGNGDRSADSNISADKLEQLKTPLSFRTPTPPADLPQNIADSNLQNTPRAESSIDELKNQQARKKHVKHFKVESGDTLAALFNRAGLSSRDVYEITQLPAAKKNLLRIIPGEEIIIVKDDADELLQLSYHINPISTLVIDKDDKGYSEHISQKKVESRNKFASATISNNFWNAGVSAGLTPNQIMQLATIFGWDIDFALDIRLGDNFAIIFEEEYADGEFLRNGNILAAEFSNQGDRYTAVRYTDGNYYSEDGRSMRKAFLRSPVDFKYVSSSFNPRRLHPVTGQVRAHRGVDYVAAVGTPIKAAGKGRVIKSAYNQYNGNYVFIKHNDTYTTKYLHLKKRKVRQGETVKQGQIIGTLGSTGRVTGAHLHYEFIVNGTHRNPRTVKLPKSLPIANTEKSKFLALSKQIMAKLQQNKQVQLASTIN